MSKILLDENLSPKLAQTLRLEGVDIVHLQEIGFKGATDEQVLREAAKRGQILLTINIWDFVKLAESLHHAGIVSIPSKDLGREAQLALVRSLLPRIVAHGDLADQILLFDRSGRLTITHLPATPPDAPR